MGITLRMFPLVHPVVNRRAGRTPFHFLARVTAPIQVSVSGGGERMDGIDRTRRGPGLPG